MHSISVDITFKAEHHLLLPNGQKEQPHVHDWQVRASVTTEQLPDTGWVMDFHHLIKLLNETVQPLSVAGCLNNLPEFNHTNPTAERLARYIYQILLTKIPNPLQLAEVTVWETKNCRATYRP